MEDGEVSVSRNIFFFKGNQREAKRDLSFSREEVEKLEHSKPLMPDVIYPKVFLATLQYFLDLCEYSAIFLKLL